ncbi:hypothetical protein CYG49_02775 [Candidatus Saccharibacteria bacterium]|nr:MAG: hypothetical protein CYG49_02775 [Candidatus Saccharibacteria bacterium]
MFGAGVAEVTGGQKQLFDDSQFASLSAAAHDLKAPLSTIQFLAASLRDSELQLTDAEREQMLWRMQLTAESSLKLVEGLTYAYSTSRLALELEPVNVAHICEDILHEFTPLSRQLGQTMELKLSRRMVPLALAHHSILRSIVSNLCDNALKHNPPESHVQLRIGPAKRGVIIAVRDNGPQLRIADFKRLKARLGKEVNPLGARVGSSGLGLFVASQLAGAMDARLDLSRHQTDGVTFSLHLQPSYQLSFL